jgi:UDP-N-acetylmuramoyl-L-alanyl-D-glutamate--2,6-diaminopimelate ligase
MVADCRARVVRYGLRTGRADLTAQITSMSADGSEYVITGSDGVCVPVSSGLVGGHNVANALAAATAAHALGFDGETIRAGIEGVSIVRGRLERVSVPGQDFAVLVDYAHTDDALRRVLAALRPLTRGRLICVFGCGGDRDRSKRPRMAAAVDEHADVAVVTSDNPRTEDPNAIIEEILSGFALAARCRVKVRPDRRRAIRWALTNAQQGDTVLVAGKGHEDYQIIGTTRRHFDDVGEARLCLQERFAPSEVPS